MKKESLFWAVTVVLFAVSMVWSACAAQRRSRRADIPEGGCVIVEMTGSYQCDVVVKKR